MRDFLVACERQYAIIPVGGHAGSITDGLHAITQRIILIIKGVIEVAKLTGRSVEEVGDMRLKANIERNGWDVNDPEHAL